MAGAPTTRWLWITPLITDRRSTGALVYSLALADAVAAQGVDLTCVGLGASDTGPPSTGRTDLLVDASPRPGWRRVVSRLPNQTSATSVKAFHHRVRGLLDERWDVVVIDGLQVGWVASLLAPGRSCCVVYVAHNHETSMRRQIARSTPWRSWRRPLLELDAIRTTRTESEAIRRSDVVSSISTDDLERFRSQAPGAHHVLVPPGWSGAKQVVRPVDMAERPRRVGIVGSFEWHAKQSGLRRFLAVADPAFARSDIELVIAGNVPEDFRRSLGDLRATSFLGWVQSTDVVLESCRVGVIAEALGGGFKLKVLDYVYGDVAVATLTHSAAGLPFTAGSSMIVADDESRLVGAIIESIDDPALLQELALEAREIATGLFSWSVAASRLVGAVDAISTVTAQAEIVKKS